MASQGDDNRITFGQFLGSSIAVSIAILMLGAVCRAVIWMFGPEAVMEAIGIGDTIETTMATDSPLFHAGEVLHMKLLTEESVAFADILVASGRWKKSEVNDVETL